MGAVAQDVWAVVVVVALVLLLVELEVGVVEGGEVGVGEVGLEVGLVDTVSNVSGKVFAAAAAAAVLWAQYLIVVLVEVAGKQEEKEQVKVRVLVCPWFCLWLPESVVLAVLVLWLNGGYVFYASLSP